MPFDSLVIVLPTTLQIETILAPFFFASLNAANVSAVSPDWEIAINRTSLSTIGSLYLNSDAISTSTGSLTSSSIINLPTRPACHDVPHATTITFFNPLISDSESFISSRYTLPVS